MIVQTTSINNLIIVKCCRKNENRVWTKCIFVEMQRFLELILLIKRDLNIFTDRYVSVTIEILGDFATNLLRAM